MACERLEGGNPAISIDGLPCFGLRAHGALEHFSIRWNRIGALALWFGRIFFDEPVSTSSENALAQPTSTVRIPQPPLTLTLSP